MPQSNGGARDAPRKFAQLHVLNKSESIKSYKQDTARYRFDQCDRLRGRWIAAVSDICIEKNFCGFHRKINNILKVATHCDTVDSWTSLTPDKSSYLLRYVSSTTYLCKKGNWFAITARLTVLDLVVRTECWWNCFVNGCRCRLKLPRLLVTNDF